MPSKSSCASNACEKRSAAPFDSCYAFDCDAEQNCALDGPVQRCIRTNLLNLSGQILAPYTMVQGKSIVWLLLTFEEFDYNAAASLRRHA